MVTRGDYSDESVEAAHSVLIELMHLLGEYKDNIVLIGGWVPEILLSSQGKPHIGSIDVDLALNHQKIREDGNVAFLSPSTKSAIRRTSKYPILESSPKLIG